MGKNISERSSGFPVWRLTIAVVVVSVLPALLNLAGFDFSSAVPVLDIEGLDVSGSPLIDHLHVWLSGSFTHTILEWSALCTAILTAVLSFACFYRTRDAAAPIIGVALFCSGAIDGFHTLAADRLIQAVADNRDLIPFTWAICRVFNVLILITGVSLFMVRPSREHAWGMKWIVGVSVLFGLVAYGVVHFCATSWALPQTQFPDAVVTRPYDVAPLVLYVFAGVTVFRMFFQAQPTWFSLALLLSVIPHVATQAHMAFGSSRLFDNHFNIGHFLKILGYLVPFLGFVADYATVRSPAKTLRESEQPVRVSESSPGGVWVPIAVGLGVVVVAVMLWMGLKNTEETGIKRSVGWEVKLVEARIKSHLDRHISALERMVDQWVAQGQMSREVWEADAANYVANFGDFQAIEWVDSSYHVRWIVPFEGNERAQDLDLGFEPKRREALEAARAKRGVTMTRPIDLVQGGKGFFVYCPIHMGDTFGGFILGVFKIQPFLESVVQEIEEKGFAIQVSIGGDVMFLRDADGVLQSRWAREQVDQWYGVLWDVRLAPSEALLGKLQSPLSNVTLGIGAIFAVISVLMVRLMQGLREWAVSLREINAKLGSQMVQRKRAEERFSLVVESSPSGMVMVNGEGQIVLVNAEVERLFGYSRDELIGERVEILVPERYRPGHPEKLEGYFANPGIRRMGAGRDLYGLRQDGSEFPLEIGLTPVKSEGGRMALATVVDITERKKSEEALARRAEELAQSNKELDDFAYVASHDLKEPLRGIHNYSIFLIEDYQDKLDQDGVDKLNTLTRLTQRMESLIDSLLEFSRVGRVDLAYRETDLNKVLEGVVDSLHIRLQEEGVEVRVPRPLPTVVCDQARVGEVFRNLITNAMKYNDKAPKWVEVGYTDGGAAASASGGGEGRAFYVRDNGIGIPEKHQESVFRIFKRLHGRDKYGGGTGAGLTIVKKIVERHGGHIWIESEVGEGTTFHFTL